MNNFKYKYRFSNGTNEIYEIKYLDLPKNMPKHLKYQWFFSFDNKQHNLTFVSSDTNYREFKEGKLYFTKTGCIFNGVNYTKI